MSEVHRRIHLNLVDSSRQLFELDPGAGIETENGWLFAAGRATHPAISNAAFRTDDAADPEELLTRAFQFFAKRQRGFSVWVRGGQPQDRDLAEAAQAAGLNPVVEMPEMVLRARAPEAPLPGGVELRLIRSPAEAADYWRVAAAAYSSIGFPPEVFRYFENREGLTDQNVAAFIAYLDGRPVSIAMTIVSHGVAGIYWVGSVEEARGRGLGRALTAAATNAGLEIGAELASLQASSMGESVYAAMGYETIYSYRLFMSPPPRAPASGRS